MATHPRTLAWKIPRMEEPSRLSPWGRKEKDTTERLHFHFMAFSYTLQLFSSHLLSSNYAISYYNTAF